jgi:hypothetical protein
MGDNSWPPQGLTELTGEVVTTLDFLVESLNKLHPSTDWTRLDWSGGSSGVQMRLPKARRLLRTLSTASGLTTSSCPMFAIRWVCSVTSCREELRRSLENLAIILGTMMHEKTTHHDRIRQAAKWSDYAADLRDEIAAFSKLLTTPPAPESSEA